MTLTVTERVSNGIAWLDEHGPADWRDRIALPAFDITSPCACVLGQVFSSSIDPECGWRSGFEFVTNELVSDDGDWASDHGFDHAAGNLIDSREDYNALQAAWTTELRR